MFIIPCDYGNTNQNNFEILSYLNQTVEGQQSQLTTDTGEYVGERKHLLTGGGLQTGPATLEINVVNLE